MQRVLLVVERCRIRILVGTSTLLTAVFRDFPPIPYTDTGTVYELRHDSLLPHRFQLISYHVFTGRFVATDSSRLHAVNKCATIHIE